MFGTKCLMNSHLRAFCCLQDRHRVEFQQGDACYLPLTLGRFDCVLAANLIDRLHTPQAFLDRLPYLITVGGILVLATPYTFMSKFTPKVREYDHIIFSGTDKFLGRPQIVDFLRLELYEFIYGL